MRRSVFFLLIAAGIGSVLSTACRSSIPMGDASSLHYIRVSHLEQSAQKSASAVRLADPPLESSLTGSWEATATKHFEVFHEPGANYVALAGQALENAYEQFYETFARAGFELSRPQDRLVWIFFPHKSQFNQYALRVEGMDLSWLDGYYSTLNNCVAIVHTHEKVATRPDSAVPAAVVANRAPTEGYLSNSAVRPRLDVTRLTHEVAHQLAFNSGIQKRGVVYPLWVSEGLATNFEFDQPADSSLEHINDARCSGLLQAYATGNLTPLREFVVQSTVPPDPSAGRRYYAQAWGFFRFVLTEHSESLRRYLHQLAHDRPAYGQADKLLAEFTAAFGTPESLEPSWNAYLAHLAWQTSAGRIGLSATPNPGAAQ